MDTAPQPTRASALVTDGDAVGQLTSAARVRAGEVVLDLAGLQPERKDAARATVITTLEAVDYGDALVTVRINAVSTMWAYRDVVDVVERVGEFVDCIAIADAATPGDVEFVDTLVGMIEQRIDLAHRIGIEAEIASAAGLMLLDDIVMSSERLAAVVLDEAAVAVSLGASDPLATEVTNALTGARLAVLTAARAAGVQAVVAPALPGTDVASQDHDTPGHRDRFRARVADARVLGYDGARCTHPTEVKAANAVFI